MLYNILLIVQILVSAAMIVLILMQHGKGADAGAAFGSGASGTVFGASGSGNFLSRTTGILATVFFLNSLGLAWLVSNQVAAPTSIIQSVETGSAPTAEAPAAPAASGDVPAAPVGEPAPAADVPPAPVVEAAPEQQAPAVAEEAAQSGADVPAAPETEQKSQ